MENHLEKYKEQLIDFGIAYGGKLAFAILLVLFGPSFIRKLTRIVEKKVDKSSIDKDVKPFLISVSLVGKTLSVPWLSVPTSHLAAATSRVILQAKFTFQK
jgi:hypothetical protein